jgi:hypothetical protein
MLARRDPPRDWFRVHERSDNLDFTLPPWRQKTRREKIKSVVSLVSATVVGVIVGVFLLLVLLEMLEGYSRLESEYRLCVQKAQTGYEIKQCD